jgi:hypothetical protein
MGRDALEVMIAGEHHQIVSDAHLRQDCVDRADLNAMAATNVAQGSGFDVIDPIGHEEGKRRESLQNLRARFGSGKTLQEFLEHQAGRHE